MKKRLSRILAFVLSLVMLFALLAGCGDKGSSNSSGNSGSSNTNSSSSGDKQDTGSGNDGFQGDPIELKIAHNNAITSPTAVDIQTWCDKIYEATNGTVKITQYPSDSLGATSSGLDMLDTGITDLFWSTTGMFAGTFNYLDTFALPLLGQESSVGGTNAIWDVYENEKWAEKIDNDFSGYKLLISYQSEGGIIGSNDPVSKAADLKGDVVRSIAGGMAKFVEACGGSATFMGPSDIYTNMQKGVIDDYVFEWAGVENFTLGELTPYFLNMDVYRVPMFIVISERAWNKLSADQQVAIESLSYREGSLVFAEGNDATQDAYIEETVAAGTELIVPTDEDYAEFVSLAEGVWANWVDDLGDSEYFDAVRAAIDANK